MPDGSFEDFRPGEDLREQDYQGKDFKGFSLAGRDCTGTRFDDSDLRGVPLSGTILDEASLATARLEGAILRGASLKWAYMYYADLQGADMRKAILGHALLLKAKLTPEDYEEADFEGVILDDEGRANLRVRQIKADLHEGENCFRASLDTFEQTNRILKTRKNAHFDEDIVHRLGHIFLTVDLGMRQRMLGRLQRWE